MVAGAIDMKLKTIAPNLLTKPQTCLQVILAQCGAMDAAIDQYRTALRLGPTFHDLRYRLARMLLEVGRSLEAREELETLVAAKPDARNIHSTLGLAYYVSGEIDRAEATWKAIQQKHPDDVRVRAYIAMLRRANEKE